MEKKQDEEFYTKVHREAVAFRRKKFEEILAKENPEPHEIAIIKRWAEMYPEEFA